MEKLLGENNEKDVQDISRERKKTNNHVRVTRGQILIDETGQSLVDTENTYYKKTSTR